MLVVFQAILGVGSGTYVVVVPCSRPISNSIVARHTSGGVGEDVERGCSEGVECALRGLPQHGEVRETERRGASASAVMQLGQEVAYTQGEARSRDTRRSGQHFNRDAIS